MKQTQGFIVPAILMGAAALMAISSLYLWHQVADLNLGATNFVGGERYRLAGSGVAAADTSITLSSFTYGPNSVELLMADFGSIGYATIEPGTANKEFISFTTVTQNANNSQATLGSVTRGLNFVAPYTASTTLRLAHSGGSTVIISNPPQLYSRAVFQDNTSTISGVWTFSATSGRPLYNQHPTWADIASTTFADKDYVDAVATSGAADATEAVKGLVELATQAEMQAGTATGSTGARLGLQADYANSTSSATTTVVITKTGGKISQGFLDLTESWTFSATTTFASTTQLNGTVNIGASGLTFNDSTTQTTAGSIINIQTFNANATWTKPTVGTYAYVRAWGAGGGGGATATGEGGGGGGGGAYTEAWFLLSDLGATETVTIGAGGANATSTNSGGRGATTTFGTWVTARAGGGGAGNSGANSGGGGGGAGNGGGGANGSGVTGGAAGVISTIEVGAGGAGSNTNGAGNKSYIGGGGGGGGGATTAGAGGATIYGGGGGGGGAGTTAGAGGDSTFAGDGGAGSTGGANATAGSAPGGGGGGASTGTSGAGAAGRVIVIVF